MSASGYIAPAPPGEQTVQYASYARRFGAALLDNLVWVVGISFFVPGSVFEGSDAAAAIAVLAIFSAWFNYYAFCEWRWGQTIGKNATGIRVLRLDGEPISWQTAALRNLLRLVDLPLALLGVTYMEVTMSPRRQRLGDRAAHTIVVREDEHPIVSAPPPPPARRDPAATAGELFGDAAEALARHPSAGSSPAPDPAPPAVSEPAPAPAPSAASLGALRWSAPGFPYASWDLRRALIGLLAGLLGALLLPVLVLPFDPDLESTGSLLAVQALFEASLIGAAVGVASGTAAGQSVASLLGLRRFGRSDLGVAAQAMLAYYSFTALYAVFVRPEQQDIARDLGLDAGIAAAVVAVVLIALVAPVVEEVFFRGMLYGGLRRRLGMYPSAAISAAVFGGLHATTGISAVPPLIAFGFVLALLYERTGSIGPGIVVHVLNNTLALIASS